MRPVGVAALNAPSRVRGVDLARGLAVLGMLAAHLLVIERFDPTRPGTWVDVVNGRSSILFATLAGVSIALLSAEPGSSGTRPRRGRAVWRAPRLAVSKGAAPSDPRPPARAASAHIPTGANLH